MNFFALLCLFILAKKRPSRDYTSGLLATAGAKRPNMKRVVFFLLSNDLIPQNSKWDIALRFCVYLPEIKVTSLIRIHFAAK
jgi:hypothetical protein